MAHFSRHGCLLDHQMQSKREDGGEPPENTDSISLYTLLDQNTPAAHPGDIVDLIKRARARTDRTLTLLRRNGEQDHRDKTADRNPLETFISGFSHHFNNLFMSLQCNVSLILIARSGEHRHKRRLQRIEKLVMAESMLTNDLLGIVIEKGCRIDLKLQAHLLDEIVAISDTFAMREAFCQWDEAVSAQTELPREALQRLAKGLAAIMHRLLNEIQKHTAFIMADGSADVVENVRLKKMMEALACGRRLLRDLTGYTTERKADGKPVDQKMVTEIAVETCLQGRENIRCHLDIPPAMHPLGASRHQVKKVLQELYRNAVAAMPQGGEIVVAVENLRHSAKCGSTGRARLTFKDNGVGMTPEVAARIFDPFFKGKASKRGQGLGLTAVHGILQSIGGRISVDSAPGDGAVFAVDWPAAHQKIEAPDYALKWTGRRVGRAEGGNDSLFLPHKPLNPHTNTLARTR
jgi:signal transduction histidine kinase